MAAGATVLIMLAAGGVLCLLFEPVTALLLLVGMLLLLFVHHLHNMAKVMRWTQQPVGTPVPDAMGVWDYIFAGLAKRSRAANDQRERLARTLARFREATQALPDGVIYLSRQHTIEWVNAAAAGFFDLDPERDQGRAITTLVRDPAFVASLEASRKGQLDAVVLRSPRQEGLMLAVQVIPFGEDQEMVLARDITQLERLDTMRRDFVANVSHELKTPLTVVNGFIETLLDAGDEFGPEDRQHFLGLALTQSQRMQHLVEDLLMLSSLQAADTAGLEESVALRGLLATVRQEVELLSGGRHRIELEVAAEAKEISLLGSAKELHSAFSNLASNAVRYTPEDGSIRLCWQIEEDGGASFSVKDSGIGIAPEHIGRLTERFYRVDHGRSRETGGTGLGLAIVKHVLTRHQAQLVISSQPGEGSCFSARFPARRLQLPAQK